MRAYTRWLIYGNLLFDGEVHHQVQEGIGRALLWGIVLILVTFRIFQHGKVFWMFADELYGKVFQRCEQFLGAVFAPGFK